jgi:hypothetical protein
LTQAIIDEELEKLAKSDPGNAEWQRDLARIYARIGKVDLRTGQRDEARRLLQKGRAILAFLRQQSPDDSTLPTHLNWFDSRSQ